MPRRRKSSASAFEFTGEEAVAAERAFRRRHARVTRKPKISVTSISPLSTISKVLNRRSTKSDAPAARPAVPSGKVRGAVASPPRANAPTTPPRKRPPSSPPTPSVTPSRRSRRRRLPSFKLRPASRQLHPAEKSPPVPVRVRIRTAGESANATRHAGGSQSEVVCSDVVSLPHPAERKRPRGVGDAHDPGAPVSSEVKKRRSDSGDVAGGGDNERDGDAAEPVGGLTPEGAVVGAVDPKYRTGEGCVGKQCNEESANAKAADELNNAPIGDDGITSEAVETRSEHLASADQKNGIGTHPSQEDVPATDLMTEEENPPAEVTDATSRAEEKDSVEVAATDSEPSAEMTRSTGARPSDSASTSCERSCSVNASASAEARVSTAHATPDAKNLLESPVTPAKPHDNASVRANPSETLPTNQKPLEVGHQEELHTSLLARKETAPEKPAASTYANSEAAERDSQEDRKVITEGPSTSLPENDFNSDEPAVVKHTNARAEAPSKCNAKPGADQTAPSPTPRTEVKEEAEVSSVPEKAKSVTPPAETERSSPAKASSSITKQVRFTEPPPTYRSSERKMGFSGIMRMRRKRIRKQRALDADFGDVSVVSAETKGPDEKNRHLLLDELQYLLDGIFETNTNGSRKGQTADNHVVASSLQSLIKLLLRKSKTAVKRNDGRKEDDSGVLVQILAEQPNLLKTIVKRLCTVLGKSRASDALLAFVFVIIFQATPRTLLLTEHDLDLLLNAFFRNSAASLQECERDGQKVDEARDRADKEPQARRRGKLGRMFEQKKPKDEILTPLLKLMADAEVIEDDCNAFKRETEAAAHLMGIAISLILRNEIETRAWMRNNRRLDKVVAVLYSCEKMMLSQQVKENDQSQQPLDNIENGPSWIVMEASLRVLEFAVLDQVCQQRLASESRVSAILLDLLKTIKSIKTGPLESEWMICAALRLCINLCHGCEAASKQLVESNGQNIVLNCLVKECVAAGLIQEDSIQEHCKDVEESFDVRVLCLAVLASTVNQEVSVCNSFHEMQAEGVEKRENGAISLVLEILGTAELEAKKEESKESEDESEEGIRRRRKTTREEDAKRERRAQFVMERKITIGYVCLLIGALACDSKSNRELMQNLLPGKSFIGVAAVLAEFLEFHHEVGIISGSMNRMYADIIKKIVEPEDTKDTKEDVKVDSEGQGEELDFLLGSPSDRDDEQDADTDTQPTTEMLAAQGEDTTQTAPVDGAE